MDYQMRRSDRQMDDADARELLRRAEYGVLATVDEDGMPYGVPISCAYDIADNLVYMHCSAAEAGHNLSNVRARPAASLTVVAETELLPDQFSTRYASVIARGHVHIASDAAEKRRGFEAILRNLAPSNIEAGMRYIDKASGRAEVLVLAVESLTGKHRA